MHMTKIESKAAYSSSAIFNWNCSDSKKNPRMWKSMLKKETWTSSTNCYMNVHWYASLEFQFQKVMAVPSIGEASWVKESEENNKAKGYGIPPQGRIHFIGSYKCSSSNWVMSDVWSGTLLPLTEPDREACQWATSPKGSMHLQRCVPALITPFTMSSERAKARPSGGVGNQRSYALIFTLIASKYAMNVTVFATHAHTARHQNAPLTVLGLIMWAAP